MAQSHEKRKVMVLGKHVATLVSHDPNLDSIDMDTLAIIVAESYPLNPKHVQMYLFEQFRREMEDATTRSVTQAAKLSDLNWTFDWTSVVLAAWEEALEFIKEDDEWDWAAIISDPEKDED